jgi:hypothetical protein
MEVVGLAWTMGQKVRQSSWSEVVGRERHLAWHWAEEIVECSRVSTDWDLAERLRRMADRIVMRINIVLLDLGSLLAGF